MVSPSPINKHESETEISIRPPNAPVSIARSDLFGENVPQLAVVAVCTIQQRRRQKKKRSKEKIKSLWKRHRTFSKRNYFVRVRVVVIDSLRVGARKYVGEFRFRIPEELFHYCCVQRWVRSLLIFVLFTDKRRMTCVARDFGCLC